MLTYGPACTTHLRPAMAFDAAPARRPGRDSDPEDPISAVLQFANEFLPEDQHQPFADLVKTLVEYCAEAPATDRRSTGARDSALTPQRINRLVHDAAVRRQAATDQTLSGMFPDLARIGQSWGRE